ncbi:MAG: hypothetical protein ACE5G6_00025 [Terriglobia bacterium]
MTGIMGAEAVELLLLVAAAFLVVALAVKASAAVQAYWKYRGTRVITCPENRKPAGVEVDARHAAWGAAVATPRLRLKDCSRWPQRQDCGRECLRQIEAAPEACLVRNILTQWYQGKSCAFCGRPFTEIHWHDHKPALLAPAGEILDWSRLQPEEIPATLATHQPVCWNCDIAESLRREHPDLVVNRPVRWSRTGDKKGERHQWVH